MLTRSVEFPLGYYTNVIRIQRTYKNTLTILILKYDCTHWRYVSYINHTEADGTEIRVYPLNHYTYWFELVNESKIFIPFKFSGNAMVIDLLTGSSKSFPLPMIEKHSFELLRFIQSGLICLRQLSSPLQCENVFN